MLYQYCQVIVILKEEYLPHIKANYLASPPLVVAYALAGHMEFDLYKEPLGKSKEGQGYFFKRYLAIK